jgi:hypothetical protein
MAHATTTLKIADPVLLNILTPLFANGGTIAVEQLLASPPLPNFKMNTKKKHLKSLLDQNPQFLACITGFFPSSKSIIDNVEAAIGLITELNLLVANQRCYQIVQSISQPMFDSFIRDELAGHVAGMQVSLPIADLIRFLLVEYAEFNKAMGNGLVSIAGALNEWLLIRAMTNAGMRDSTDFEKTGTDSEADLVIHSRGPRAVNLGVEIKSYRARERLLRGLHDIKGLKVGVGFFIDPNEFNCSRTRRLIQACPAAIYMPRATLDAIDPDALALSSQQPIAFDSRLYRPLEQFVSDMLFYNSKGQLPRY